MKTKMVLMSVVLFGLMMAGQVFGGSLEPSAAPGPTMKTLDEVEPRIPISQADIPLTINTSGSYYLTEDVTAAGTAIIVGADDVTIDLAGFALVGPGSGINYGIYMNGRNNVEIRNGTIRDFRYGIRESSPLGQGHRVIDIRAVSNGLMGIFLISTNNLVKDCTASDNGTGATSDVDGIYVYPGSTVTGNTVYNNGSSASTGYVYGINASRGCTVTGNTVYNNGDSALVTLSVYGIKAGDGCTVSGNTVYDNGDFSANTMGIYVGSGCTVTGNTAYDNGSSAVGSVYGIRIASNSLVDQNTAYNNGSGAGWAINMNDPGNCTFGTNHAP